MGEIKLYLDQNVYGHMLDHSSGDWRQHPIAKTIISAQTDSRAGVWVGPEHVIETSLASDPSRRQALAAAMLECCGATRILPGSDFLAVSHFGEFINLFSEGGFNREGLFRRYESDVQHLWLGYLALLAATRNFKMGGGLATVRRAKLESQLIHARIMASPEEQVTSLLDATQQVSTTQARDPLGLSGLTENDIRDEIEELTPRAVADTSKTLRLLEKNRSRIAAVYGTIQIGRALESVFWHPFGLPLVFDGQAIVRGWDRLQEMTSCPPLPSDITQQEPAMLRCDEQVLRSILQHTINAALEKDNAAFCIGYYALVRELEASLRSGQLPTAGATLDVNHASAAMECDLFVCRDDKLAESVRMFFNRLRMKDKEVVRNAKQLEKAIDKRERAVRHG